MSRFYKFVRVVILLSMLIPIGWLWFAGNFPSSIGDWIGITLICLLNLLPFVALLLLSIFSRKVIYQQSLLLIATICIAAKYHYYIQQSFVSADAQGALVFLFAPIYLLFFVGIYALVFHLALGALVDYLNQKK